VQAWLLEQPNVMGVEQAMGNGEGNLEVTFAGDEDALAQLLRNLVGAGFPVLSFREQAGDLEDVFMRLTKGVVS
jgi:ABC-2 type transport system ATP-binding protein